jgi:hypothetical protein
MPLTNRGPNMRVKWNGFAPHPIVEFDHPWDWLMSDGVTPAHLKSSIGNRDVIIIPPPPADPQKPLDPKGPWIVEDKYRKYMALNRPNAFKFGKYLATTKRSMLSQELSVI